MSTKAPTAGTTDGASDLDQRLIVHATTIVINGRAALISGAAGSGKSALALELIALGAKLVADDRTILEDIDGVLVARAPSPIQGMIEARGVGLLNVDTVPCGNVVLAINMDEEEQSRLPDLRYVTYLGHNIALQHKVNAPYFASAVYQLLTHGRRA
ncbi:hypothetical protein FAP39_13245 [Shimia litoralis]|uniref:HPr kinase/phosphorylase C-terminal domain-containing protein n=1 Tax=Shimia litoralis TaxID=420403 RepID=A0A4U7MZ01_9RHOB|nr:HPr kinase/phosphatase C-terminal domain-containing protein [Shimia litoralis]TKZ18036.1 hypothetical protein FAP39_13245 [Shimia litoralis]